MSWQNNDVCSEHMAIVQLYTSGIAEQNELAEIFGLHINSIQKYIYNFSKTGIKGLLSERSGPKDRWKVTPQLKAKILLIVLKLGISEYKNIQEKLKEWNEDVSIGSIHQTLLENGLVSKRKNISEEDKGLVDLFENEIEEQFYLGFNFKKKLEEENSEKKNNQEKQQNTAVKELNSLKDENTKIRSYYSSSQRKYLDGLEEGEYNTYAGGLLFVPLLRKYNFLPMVERIINIREYEGYTLEQLCLCLFYFDIFESIENFKTVYSDEYGVLIGKTNSPSIYTLRRFLHKIRKLKKGEELIEEFGRGYLRGDLVKWGVLYIDSHFLPYYGYTIITMGLHTVRNKILKGSHSFIANDAEFNPFIFLIRASSEDLLRKIPEIIEKSKKIAEEVGIDSSNLIVIFDREGYCAELFRKLDGEEWEGGVGEGKKIKFITWAKYADKWVGDFDESKFTEEVAVEYKIRNKKVIRYFVTERTMSKYGKIKAIVIKNGPDEKRTAIYTNAKDIADDVIIQLICKRWGQENLIKVLKLRHLLDYLPGYIFDELAEQPMVDNPEIIELKKRRSQLISQLHSLELKLAEKIIDEKKAETSLEEMKKKESEIFLNIAEIKIQIKIINLEIEKLPKEIKYDSAHDGVKLLEMDYEKKLFLDCIKVFAYHIEKKMCEILLKFWSRSFFLT